jgi:uncharacterized protein (DUF362 family)
MAHVVIERLAPSDYARDCAALSRDYGSPEWDGRPEVAAIRHAVFAALDALDEAGGLSRRLGGRHVLVKPNLVTVYHEMGLSRRSYPESTDPRVLDAAVLWLSSRASRITIVESSGRGAPTRGSFRVSGLDRLARHRGCGLLALDESPVDRYLLPKAKVQREILVPRIFSEVVRGEAAYVSVPKLKTNLYTGVTLGFKNAMGVIPYNLRQRNHHYDIDRKLVEMLWLFRPDLVLIDGVVGGEGECPAPVDPVDSRMIIAGDHAVETDRVATRLMGFDPADIKLMRIADELGFGAPEGVEVSGDASPVAFRPADASLISDRVRASFPRAKILVGIDRLPLPPGSPEPATSADPAFVRAMEGSCRGGCVATTRFAFSMFEAEGIGLRRDVVLILGKGVESGGQRFWYDAEGRGYDEAAIAGLRGRKLAVGSCAAAVAPLSDRFARGCMPLPNAPHMLLHELGGSYCRVMSLRNRNLFPMLLAVLGQRRARRDLLESGERLDVPLGLEDGCGSSRELTAEEASRDWIEWPLPPLGPEEAQSLLGFEDDAALAGFRGILVFRLKEKLLWRLKAVLTCGITLAPLGLAAAAALLPAEGPGSLGLGALGWLGIFCGIEALHCLELPAARRAARLSLGRRGETWTPAASRRAILGTLLVGYPSWVPKKLGVFD